jgi:hypothetical protein
MKDRLETCVEEALEIKLKRDNASSPSELLGDCFYNVSVLEDVLQSEGIEYTVYRGALIGDYRPDNQPDSFKEANEIGRVHYWIESNGYTCEICSESELEYGESIVSDERPPNYITFQDSEVDTIK